VPSKNSATTCAQTSSGRGKLKTILYAPAPMGLAVVVEAVMPGVDVRATSVGAERVTPIARASAGRTESGDDVDLRCGSTGF
jgi:hypothetical protein